MDDTTTTLLCDWYASVPEDVAATLLAACSEEDLFEILRGSSGLRFAGASAIAAAKSHPIRAAIIATRTSDVAVQQAIIDLSEDERFEDAVLALGNSKLVTDVDILRRAHDRVYSENLRNRSCTILDRVDIEYAISYFEAHLEVYGSDLSRLGSRIGTMLASDGAPTAAVRFLRACEVAASTTESYSTPRRHIQSGAGALGTALTAAGGSKYLANLLDGIDERIAYSVVFDAWHHAELIDEHLAAIALTFVDAERFAQQVEYGTTRRGADVVQYPAELDRQKLKCTDTAWRLLAAQWPGILRVPVRPLTNDDPQRDLLVELAVASERSDLAAMLIDRMYHDDGRRSGPLVTASQYHTVVQTMRNPANVPAGIPQPRGTAGAVAVGYIPHDAALDDVLRAWHKDSFADIVSTMCNPQHADWHAWRPTPAEFEQILDRSDPRELARAVYEGVHAYGARDYRRCSAQDLVATRPYIDAAVERFPARNIISDHGGPAYVAERLSEVFGSDPDRWLTAWRLAERSELPLGAVINTATKLG